MIQSTVDEIRDRLRTEGWLCLESGDRRRTVTIIARRGSVSVSVSSPGREAAWDKLAARIPAHDGGIR
jgi:hypothetical protein